MPLLCDELCARSLQELWVERRKDKGSVTRQTKSLGLPNEVPSGARTIRLRDPLIASADKAREPLSVDKPFFSRSSADRLVWRIACFLSHDQE